MKIKHIALIPALCILLCACGEKPGTASESVSAWPPHAPDATPYVRLYSEPEQTADDSAAVYSSLEDMYKELYEQVGCFWFKDWELEMFRGLPQDEPYSFVVHNEASLSDMSEPELLIPDAEKFTALGCDAEIRAMCAVEGGKERYAYTMIVRTEPEHLWEISGAVDGLYVVEQLYPSVDVRFDIHVWPGEVQP